MAVTNLSPLTPSGIEPAARPPRKRVALGWSVVASMLVHVAFLGSVLYLGSRRSADAPILIKTVLPETWTIEDNGLAQLAPATHASAPASETTVFEEVPVALSGEGDTTSEEASSGELDGADEADSDVDEATDVARLLKSLDENRGFWIEGICFGPSEVEVPGELGAVESDDGEFGQSAGDAGGFRIGIPLPWWPVLVSEPRAVQAACPTSRTSATEAPAGGAFARREALARPDGVLPPSPFLSIAQRTAHAILQV